MSHKDESQWLQIAVEIFCHLYWSTVCYVIKLLHLMWITKNWKRTILAVQSMIWQV